MSWLRQDGQQVDKTLGFDRADMQEVHALLAELGGQHWRDLTSRQQCAQFLPTVPGV